MNATNTQAQTRCTKCGFRSSATVFVAKKDGVFCPKCKGPSVPVVRGSHQIAGADTTATPATTNSNASFLGIATPNDVRQAKDSLAPYVEQLKVATSQAPCQAKMSEPLMAGWATWLKGWETFYAQQSTLVSAQSDMATVEQKRVELGQWQAKIDSLCGGSTRAPWTFGGAATVAGVALVGGILTYYAKMQGGWIFLPVGAAAIGATSLAYFVAAPASSALVPLPPQQAKKPGLVDSLRETASSMTSFGKVAVVVGGVVALYVVYQQMTLVRGLAPQVLDKIQVIPVPV